MSITEETRREAFWHKEEFAEKRRAMICKALEEKGPMTAEELTNYFGVSDKNFVKPRLSEMSKQGILEKQGKRLSPTTNVHTTVWAIVEEHGKGRKSEVLE